MILLDDGQTVKKLLNHEDSAGLALSYSERWPWLIPGERLGTPFGTNYIVTPEMSHCSFRVVHVCSAGELAFGFQLRFA